MSNVLQSTVISSLTLPNHRRNEDVFVTRVPALWLDVATVPGVDWGYTMTAQAGLNGRGALYQRAKVLGGCSSHSKYILS